MNIEDTKKMTSYYGILYNVLRQFSDLLQQSKKQKIVADIRDIEDKMKLTIIDAIEKMGNIESLQEISNLEDELRTKDELIQEQQQTIDNLKNELTLATARERILEQKLFDIEDLVRPINEGLPTDKLCRELMLVINRCG